MIDPSGPSQQDTYEIENRVATKAPDPGAPSHIALFMPSLGGGGVERVMLNLARAFLKRGHRVDLLVCRTAGSFRDQISAQLDVVALQAASAWWARLLILAADPKGLKTWLRSLLFPFQGFGEFRCFADLLRYLRRERPSVLLSAMTKPNFMAVWARHLAGVPTRVVISEHNTFSLAQSFPAKKKWERRQRHLPTMVERVYSGADAIIAVSNGVADDLAQCTGILRERITTIYNPIVTPELVRQATAPLDHPWLQSGTPPVVLGVGRFHEQKDFPTLLRAFARVRAKQAARLMILGEADAKHTTFRAELMTLATQLGIADDVALPGFVANPFAYLARAAVFVLSSAWEGLPSVLIEALACGCPVVSTDCPSGPAEILENGKYGPLVPVGDEVMLAEAILSVLNTPPNRDCLRARGALFAVDHVADRYLAALLGSA
jgi:glycosyltransferase involved in cell wall biosynthesis